MGCVLMPRKKPDFYIKGPVFNIHDPKARGYLYVDADRTLLSVTSKRGKRRKPSKPKPKP
jgi:hypothetical protein